MKKKFTLATLWLDGCSGCHMSLVDVDERLIDVAGIYDIVFSPLVDVKEFPEKVDVTLLEGAISTDEDVEMVKRVRRSTKTLIAFGDCAVTSNVPSMRNHFKVEDVFKRGYLETTPGNTVIPDENIPKLLDKAYPVHHFVHVDVFLHGCPPTADNIFYTLVEIAEGRTPELSKRARFG
jgi:NAD-reducing hydrogenase small subunit